MDLPRAYQLHNNCHSSGKISWYLFSFPLDNRNNLYKIRQRINILSYVCAYIMILIRLFAHGVLFLAVLTAFIVKHQIKGDCADNARKPKYVFVLHYAD